MRATVAEYTRLLSRAAASAKGTMRFVVQRDQAARLLATCERPEEVGRASERSVK